MPSALCLSRLLGLIFGDSQSVDLNDCRKIVLDVAGQQDWRLICFADNR
jgi:hypothetical protein